MTYDAWNPPAASPADRLRSLLERVRYKPEWTFAVAARARFMLIEIKTVDSLTGRPRRISQAVPIPNVLVYATDDELADWLMRQVIAIETHEAMEFFAVDGRALFFPHDRGQNYCVPHRHSDPPEVAPLPVRIPD